MININDHKSIEKVVRFFEEFSAIPHGSGNTSMIADYLVNFAKERNLEYSRDDADNVVIRKAATKGYENRPGVIFQGMFIFFSYYLIFFAYSLSDFRHPPLINYLIC